MTPVLYVFLYVSIVFLGFLLCKYRKAEQPFFLPFGLCCSHSSWKERLGLCQTYKSKKNLWLFAFPLHCALLLFPIILGCFLVSTLFVALGLNCTFLYALMDFISLIWLAGLVSGGVLLCYYGVMHPEVATTTRTYVQYLALAITGLFGLGVWATQISYTLTTATVFKQALCMDFVLESSASGWHISLLLIAYVWLPYLLRKSSLVLFPCEKEVQEEVTEQEGK